MVLDRDRSETELCFITDNLILPSYMITCQQICTCPEQPNIPTNNEQPYDSAD